MEKNNENIYLEIINYYRSNNIISPSIIQKEFKIGYNKAYEYYEKLQKDKIIKKVKRKQCTIVVGLSKKINYNTFYKLQFCSLSVE